jgi:hypothetical protein
MENFMKPRRISLLLVLVVLCIFSISIVAGSSLVNNERAAPGNDLIKKVPLEGSPGLKGICVSNVSVVKVVAPGSDSGIKARTFYKNISVTGWGYGTSHPGLWPASLLLPKSLRGTEIIQGIGKVRSTESEDIFLIITSDGTQYLPSDLPEKYAIDGLTVEFKAYKMPISPAVRMRGTPIRIISITPTSSKEGKIETTGTVTWVSLEGGFYGIIADDGTQYDPVNLPDEYTYDGLRIGFTATEEPDVVSFHMWGTSVTITDVVPLNQDATYNKDILVDYKRTGGIAGFNDHLTVYENGVTVVTTKNTENSYTLSSDEIKDIIDLFESSGFNSVNQQDLPMFKVSGNDFFMYSIEFRGHTLESIEYAFPDSLSPVIERLNNLVLQGMS